MKEITQENYQQLEYNWEGIIIAYPKVDLYWNAEFYVYKQELNEKNEYIYKCCGYSKEDSVYDGFSGDWSKKDFESCFGNWDKLTYYQFKDLKEFCEWYLHKEDKLHQALEQFVEDTKKFYDTPKDLNDKLITERIERRNKEHYFMEKYGFNPYEEQFPEGLGYWAIYNDENCDNELKRIIQKKCPEIKEFASFEAKIVKQYSCGKVYTHDEVRDKINPGWNPRREKLQDVLKLLELRDRRQSTLDTLLNAKEPSLVEHLQNQLDRDDKRIEDFLNERIY